MQTPTTPDALVRQFTWRLRRAVLLRAGLLGGLTLAAAWLLSRRLGDWGLPPGVAAGLPGALAAAVCGGLAWWARRLWPRSGPQAARQLDRLLRLEDRLVTAHEFGRAPQPPALYPDLMTDALRTCRLAAVRYPRPMDRTCGVLLVAVLLLLFWPRAVALLPPSLQPPDAADATPTAQPSHDAPADAAQSQSGGAGQESSAQGERAGADQASGASGSRAGESGGAGHAGAEDGRTGGSSGASGEAAGQERQSASGHASSAAGQAGTSEAAGGASGRGDQAGRDGDTRGQPAADGRAVGSSQASGAGADAAQQASASGDRPGSSSGPQGTAQSAAAGQSGDGTRGDRLTAQQAAAARNALAQQQAAAARGQSGTGGAGAGDAALTEDIQQLLQEVSGELKDLQAAIASAQPDARPAPGTGTDANLYGAAESTQASGVPLAVLLGTDTAPTTQQRPGGGVGRAGPTAETGAPQTAREAAALSAQPTDEQGVLRQPVPAEYRSVFDRLQVANPKDEATHER